VDREVAEKALAAVNEASGQVALAWASFLSVGTYLAVTIGSTTHVDLLLGKQITLPVLGVDLGLVTFYWAAPLLFLLFHVYFLIQLYALAGKIHAFNALMAEAGPQAAAILRARLHIVMLTQALAGPRPGIVAQFVRQVTLWLTAVLLPVNLLVLFLVQFLPYHDEWMTWWHRLAILLDVLFLFVLWPIILHPSGAMWPIWRDMGRLWRGMHLPGSAHAHVDHVRGVRQSVVAVGLVSLLLLVAIPAVLLVATIPDEWLERRLIAFSDRWMPSAVVGRAPEGRRMLAVTAWLFEGEINEVTLAPESLFTRNLVIVQQDLVDDAGSEKVEYSLNLRGRRLENAVFTGSDLHKADLSGADLHRATLRDANLQGARLACPASGRIEECTRLDRANLQGVQLQGASLWRASLKHAFLAGAQFHAADLGEAQLAGDLGGAAFDGAMLGGAQFLDARGVTERTFARASWANMPRPPDLNWRQHLQCGNSRGTVDLVFMAQGPMPLVCDAFAQAEIRLAEALALYKQAALAIRDPSTRNRARRQLAALLEQGDVCTALQEAAYPLGVAMPDELMDQWTMDVRAVHDQPDCPNLAALKGRGLQEIGGPATR
jgi:hypothetical protein